MFLQQLELKKFRNYNHLYIDLTPGINIFYGQNAQGKSNLLEAISLLCLGRSFRTKKETELIQWNSEYCYLKGIFNLNELSQSVEIGISPDKKKYKINSQLVKSTDLFNQVAIVSFAPDDLQIIKGGPQLRRDFIDLYLAQIEPKYRYVYLNFLKVLQQRNRFLKEIGFPGNEADVWNEQLILKGTKVIKYRAQLIEKIKFYILKAHQLISLDRESINLEYISLGLSDLQNKSEEDIQKLFFLELEKVQTIEYDRKLTLVGPQRDDLKITVNNGVELRSYGSQGQQRTASLALKLGMIEVLKECRGTTPILLLDDVMSEFDDDRKRALLKMLISSSQTFLTSTSKKDFPIADCVDTSFYLINEGEVFNGN